MRLRRIDLTFTALLVPLDALALFAAGLGAYALRFSRFVQEVRPILQDVPFQSYLETVGLFALVWMLLFAMAGLYSTQERRAYNEAGRIALACTAGAMILIATVFFRREFTTSRFIVLAVWIFSILFVTFGRYALRQFRYLLLRMRIGHRTMVIIGNSTAADSILDEYKKYPVLGYTVLRHFKSWNEETRRSLDRLCRTPGVDVVLLAEPSLAKDKALELIAYTEEHHLTFYYLADLFAARFTNINVFAAAGVPIIEVKRTPLDGWGRIAKRAFDVVFALIFLIVTSPIALFAMLAVMIEDGLPVIFEQIRVGEKGLQFKLYKLRSMYRKFSIGPQFTERNHENLKLERQLIAERNIKQGPVFKIADDPRVTTVGRILRRWSLDEMPQFINVLKGDMSIVGPRPHLPREVEKYETHHRRVLGFRPGITGLAQISGRSDLQFEDEVRLDTWYIENWSLWRDLYIILKTPVVVLKKKGAY